MCSQNGKWGTGKLVAKHSTRQGLGDRACGLAQKGMVSMGLAVRLALPLQCVYWEEVSSGWVPAVQRVQCASLQCRGAVLLSLPLQRVGWTLALGGWCRAAHVGQGGHPVCACSVPVWSGREWEGTVSAVSERNSICWCRVWGCLVTVQQRGDAVTPIAVCWGCAVPLLRGEAQGLPCGVRLHCSAGWAVSLCPSNTGVGNAPVSVRGTGGWQCPARRAG